MTGVRAGAALSALCALATFTGCNSDADGGIRIRSLAFDDGGAIPERHSCEGENVSPPLAWQGVPDDAAELTLVVTDPDAPEGVFYHWLVLRIDPAVEAVDAGEVPAGAVEAKGSSDNPTYIGMCPPAGERHMYRFTLHALDERLPDGVERMPPREVVRLVTERSMTAGSTSGTFGGGP